MPTAFARQQWLRERALMLRYTYIACLVLYNSRNSQTHTHNLTDFTDFIYPKMLTSLSSDVIRCDKTGRNTQFDAIRATVQRGTYAASWTYLCTRSVWFTKLGGEAILHFW
jgi:hypothetical protein